MGSFAVNRLVRSAVAALFVWYSDKNCSGILVGIFLHLLSIFWICSGCGLILFCKIYLGLGRRYMFTKADLEIALLKYSPYGLL